MISFPTDQADVFGCLIFLNLSLKFKEIRVTGPCDEGIIRFEKHETAKSDSFTVRIAAVSR